MSDEVAKQFEQEKSPSPLPEGRSVSLTITMHPNGQVEFNIPQNLVLAHGLLGMASAKLTELQLISEAKRQQVARGNGVEGLLRKIRGG